jgi:adenylylsulfate kinase-like enzyme
MLFVFAVHGLKKRTKSNTIVLTGLSGSGKTVLFHQVIILNYAFLC